jgi:hypothetical protein
MRDCVVLGSARTSRSALGRVPSYDTRGLCAGGVSPWGQRRPRRTDPRHESPPAIPGRSAPRILSRWRHGFEPRWDSGLPSSDWPPRWLAMLHGPNDPAGATVSTQSPCLCRDSTFSRPWTKSASPPLQARERSRWGVNGDSDASGSARQQQTSRRSTGSPRAGSEGEGSLATRRSARADERETRGSTGGTVQDASRTGEPTAPNPGTS